MCEFTKEICTPKEALEYIYGLGCDYNGFSTAEELRGLIDDFVDVAHSALELIANDEQENHAAREYFFLLSDGAFISKKVDSFMQALVYMVKQYDKERWSLFATGLRGFDPNNYSSMVEYANCFLRFGIIEVFSLGEQLFPERGSNEPHE